MHKFLLLLVLFIGAQSEQTFAQAATSPNVMPTGKHTYYMYFSGVKQRSDVVFLEDLINKKEPVKFFIGNRFPVRYFKLISDEPVTEAMVTAWLNGRYSVEVFGDDEQSLSKCRALSKKNNNLVKP